MIKSVQPLSTNEYLKIEHKSNKNPFKETKLKHSVSIFLFKRIRFLGKFTQIRKNEVKKETRNAR